LTNLTQTQIEQIEAFSEVPYLELDDTHDLNHAKKTERLAIYLAKRESGDMQICRLGALLHQYHPEGVKKVELFLRSIEVDESIASRIAHCVKSVELDTIHNAETIEAKIVFDADKLQTLGPYGFIREVVYRTRNKDITFVEAFEEARALQELIRVNLQTNTAKKIYDNMNRLTQNMIENFNDWNELTFTMDIPDK
jgi:HD superfamily phosphodiesterase